MDDNLNFFQMEETQLFILLEALKQHRQLNKLEHINRGKWKMT